MLVGEGNETKPLTKQINSTDIDILKKAINLMEQVVADNSNFTTTNDEDDLEPSATNNDITIRLYSILLFYCFFFLNITSFFEFSFKQFNELLVRVVENNYTNFCVTLIGIHLTIKRPLERKLRI